MKKLLIALNVVFLVIIFNDFAFAGNNELRKIIPVTGIVKDDEGNPLAGATVTEKGTKNVVLTNDNGEFTISVQQGAVLTITYVGFQAQDVVTTAGNMVVTMIRNA